MCNELYAEFGHIAARFFCRLILVGSILQLTTIEKNIARGTTDPGYWVYNLNHFSDGNQFDIILAEREDKGVLNSDIFILVTIVIEMVVGE